MDRIFTRFSQYVAMLAGQPQAFILAITIILIWSASGPIFGWSDTWQLVINNSTTIVTFLMVFLIQNAQNRDASAIQAKLDELIRALKPARNEFIGIEHLTETELREIQKIMEETYGKGSFHHGVVQRLIKRR
ncbi:MAG: low affinity iron permease family protein [Alphaproteobacteria bacterium]|nr:low affinity iron permease family protein [Alphaproteobacteria bacterium]